MVRNPSHGKIPLGGSTPPSPDPSGSQFHVPKFPGAQFTGAQFAFGKFSRKPKFTRCPICCPECSRGQICQGEISRVKFAKNRNPPSPHRDWDFWTLLLLCIHYPGILGICGPVLMSLSISVMSDSCASHPHSKDGNIITADRIFIHTRDNNTLLTCWQTFKKGHCQKLYFLSPEFRKCLNLEICFWKFVNVDPKIQFLEDKLLFPTMALTAQNFFR